MAPRPRMLRRPGASGDSTHDRVVESPREQCIDPGFDEATYLRAFPDVADAVRRGVFASGHAHLLHSGQTEGRLRKSEYRSLLGDCAERAPPQIMVDALTISTSGAALMTGWSDDRLDRLIGVSLETGPDPIHDWTAFPRLLRTDVERTLDVAPGYRFGFLLIAAPTAVASRIDLLSANAPTFRFASGFSNQPRRHLPMLVSDLELRDLALATLPTAAAPGADPGAMFDVLDQNAGERIATINRLIVEQARARQMIERFGPTRSRFRGSIITTLRGGADWMVPWLTLVGAGAKPDEYEFIIAVPNVEQFEPAMRAARIAEATIGLSLTLVLRPGGDPACGDTATDVARSDRLIFMDQAVLPCQHDWAARHAALLDSIPPEQTRLFGGMLHRPDGSLSNGGYYFERETSFRPKSEDPARRVSSINLKAITHPAPSIAGRIAISRPIAGVSSAFLSVDRAWFENLGQFTGRYCRAVHEDIDLCLRSLKHDVPVWSHPLPMWHFERRQPVRPEPSKGGTILNSWLLHRQWDDLIAACLLTATRVR
jgi:hypothetical protein